MKIRLLLLTALAAALLALPAPALADDAAVYQAWTAEDARGERIGKRMDREGKRASKSKFRRWKAYYRSIKDFARYTGDVERAVAAQQASTPKGTETRDNALKGLRLMRLSFESLARSVRLVGQRKPNAALKALNRAKRLAKRGNPLIRRAERGFRELGFTR